MDEIYELQNALRSLDEGLHILKHSKIGSMLKPWNDICVEWQRCERLAKQLSDVMNSGIERGEIAG